MAATWIFSSCWNLLIRSWYLFVSSFAVYCSALYLSFLCLSYSRPFTVYSNNYCISDFTPWKWSEVAFKFSLLCMITPESIHFLSEFEDFRGVI